MMISLKQKSDCKDYWNEYAIKKIQRLLLPLLLSGVCYFFTLRVIVQGQSIWTAMIESIEGITKGRTVTLNAWYAYLLLWFCVLFLCSYYGYSLHETIQITILRLLALTVLIGITVVLMVFILQWGGWWSKACFAFPMGIAWCCYADKIKPILRKHWKIILLISGLIYPLAYIGDEMIQDSLINRASIILYPISSCIVVVFFCYLSQSLNFVHGYLP